MLFWNSFIRFKKFKSLYRKETHICWFYSAKIKILLYVRMFITVLEISYLICSKLWMYKGFLVSIVHRVLCAHFWLLILEEYKHFNDTNEDNKKEAIHVPIIPAGN